jgi:outer membrane lipopolysaccharide assembly protein LptE/RlpB
MNPKNQLLGCGFSLRKNTALRKQLRHSNIGLSEDNNESLFHRFARENGSPLPSSDESPGLTLTKVLKSSLDDSQL